MTYDKMYFPYPSTDKIKKFFIITNQGKKIRFGAKSYEHFKYVISHYETEKTNSKTCPKSSPTDLS